MFAAMRPALVLFLMLTLITGVLYPLAVTGIAQGVLGHAANGSLLVRDGAVVGSELLGQSFSDTSYFWGRPSATSAVPTDGAASSGSNLGPTNPALLAAIERRVAALHAADPLHTTPIPVDLVTTSASGLDPDISPAAAEYQVGRVARVRGMDVQYVRQIVLAHTQSRTFGLLGEPRVNVLRLNLALDAEGAGR